MLVPNEPSINAVYDPIKICKSLEKEIVDLRKELSMYDTLTNRRQISYEPLSETQVREIKSQVREFVDGQIQEIEIINIRQVKEVFEQFKMLVKKAEESKVEIQEKKEVILPEKVQTQSKGKFITKKSLSLHFNLTFPIMHCVRLFSIELNCWQSR